MESTNSKKQENINELLQMGFDVVTQNIKPSNADIEAKKDASLPVLSLINKVHTFRSVLFHLGFTLVSESEQYALLSNNEGDIVVARFNDIDNPIQVYIWPLGKVVSKSLALLHFFPSHELDKLETLTVKDALEANGDNKDFSFSEPLNELEARKLCLRFTKIPIGFIFGEINVLPLTKGNFTDTVFVRNGHLSFLLFKNSKICGAASLWLNEKGLPMKSFIGNKHGYYTNKKPSEMTKAVVYFSLEGFLFAEAFHNHASDKVFVFTDLAGLDVFSEVISYCYNNELDLEVKFFGENSQGFSNYIRFNLFYIGTKNNILRGYDFQQGEDLGEISFSVSKEGYSKKVIHFSDAYNKLREVLQSHYEGLMLQYDDFKDFLPELEIKKKLSEDFYATLSFYTKEPIVGYVLGYFYKAFKVKRLEGVEVYGSDEKEVRNLSRIYVKPNEVKQEVVNDKILVEELQQVVEEKQVLEGIKNVVDLNEKQGSENLGEEDELNIEVVEGDEGGIDEDEEQKRLEQQKFSYD